MTRQNTPPGNGDSRSMPGLTEAVVKTSGDGLGPRAEHPNDGDATGPRGKQRDAEERVAENDTRFAGSMRFVYLHVVMFGVVDKSPIWASCQASRNSTRLL
jgi:hypothetical protein